jgi:hypothetical protein
MRKKLEIDLYRTALSILHRLLAYQIKHKAKLGSVLATHWQPCNYNQINICHSQVPLVTFLAGTFRATQVFEFSL